MEDGKGARKSNDITATLTREARSANNKQKITEQTRAGITQETEIGQEKEPHSIFWQRQEISCPINSRQPNRNGNPTLQIASRHPDGQGRQQSRSGREEGWQQQLDYTPSCEEEEWLDQ